MRKILVLVFAISMCMSVHAQFIKDKAINASIGYGLSAAFEDDIETGSGFYLQGELVLSASSWFDIRPYAGLVLTSANKEQLEETGYKSTANAFLVGGKARITAPIPWVSPYIEFGIGASLGSFETVTPVDDIDQSGFTYHIPFTLGLDIGKTRKFGLAFVYYVHPEARQFSGAAAIGVSFPLNND